MGWLVNDHGLPYGETVDSHLRKRMCAFVPGSNVRGTILASALVGSTWYAAQRIERASEKPFTTALVVLTTRRGGCFGYKDMSEACGPCEVDCPKRIMDLLSPVSDLPHASCAQDWRDRVVARRAEKARQRKAISNLTPGARIKLAEPVRFSSGFEADEFTVLPRCRRQHGTHLGHPSRPGVRFKLSASTVAKATLIPEA